VTLGPRFLPGIAALCLSVLPAMPEVEGALAPSRPARPQGVVASAASVRDEVSLVIGRAGWKPSVVETHKGAPLRFVLNAEDGEHCFAIDVFRVERRVVAGRETRVDVVPDQVGTFAFYDCLAPEGRRTAGRLVVTD